MMGAMAQVRITVASARVVVRGEDRTDVAVDGADRSGTDGDVVVEGGSQAVTVLVPTGTDVVVGSESGTVALEGELGSVRVTTSSGAVEAHDVGAIDARTASGRLAVRTSRGPVRLTTRSARIDVGRADGPVTASTTSGRLQVGEARAGASLRSVSGRVELGVSGTGEVDVETVSGRVDIAVRGGGRPEVQLRSNSGRRRIECETGTDFPIRARTVSGRITVTKA
jgi:DUF4097 and DUF4098 domain-containing protein YvlB